jgi:hypothetical protein
VEQGDPVSSAIPFDHRLPVLTFEDMRLTRLFHQEPQRCATVNEYAAATGLTVDRLLEMLAAPLQRGELDVEAVGGEIFVQTAPMGRPAPAGFGQTQPNLWEVLRRDHSREQAYALWRIMRDMESGGWHVEADSRFVPTGRMENALLGLKFSLSTVPVLVIPDLADVSSQSGPLTSLEIAGMGLCAVTCLHRKLDATVTAVRQWMLGRPARAGLDVIVLEAPRYQPVLLTSDDGSMTPRSVSVDTIASGR